MKKTFLFFFMTFLVSWNTLKAQVGGNDYIVMLDNGSSIDETSYTEMKRGAVKLIEWLLACNRNNRVAVVQYGTGIYGDTSGMYKPLIYIESDFTTDQFTAQNFKRRLDFGDHFHESLGLIEDALVGNANADIVSHQVKLNQAQPLKVIVFTDAERNSVSNDSYLVDPNNAAIPGLPAAFENVVKFKIKMDAKFTMIHVSTNGSAMEAAASIASQGGNYMGSLEGNMQDPDYNLWPRSYYNRDNGFGVTAMETDYWKNIAENICDSTGWGTLNFKYEPACVQQPSDVGGYYNLPSGATLHSIRLFMVNIDTGTEYPVDYFPVYGPNNHYTYQLQYSDFSYAVNSGATGNYKLKAVMIYNYNGITYNAYSWNHYPFFDYDVRMKCSKPRAANNSIEEKIFKLTPNPTHGLFKAILNKEVKSGTLEVRDLVGNVVFNKILRGEKEIEVDLSSRKEGVYMVTVTTDNNQTSSEKIIKK